MKEIVRVLARQTARELTAVECNEVSGAGVTTGGTTYTTSIDGGLKTQRDGDSGFDYEW